MGAKLYLIGGIVLMSLGFFQAASNGAREKALERESARVVASATGSVSLEKTGRTSRPNNELSEVRRGGSTTTGKTRSTGAKRPSGAGFERRKKPYRRKLTNKLF